MTTLRAYFTIINNRLAYNVQAENTFRHGKKSHYTHRRVFWTNNLDSKCRNLYTNNYTNQLVVRYPEDIRKGKYFYTRESDNEWSECSQNVFLSAYNYMTVEDEQKILKVSPDFKYTLNKFAISDMCHSYTVLNVWKLYNLWLNHPECEFVIMSRLSSLLFNKSFYRLKLPKQKEILRFMKEHPEVPRYANLSVITRLIQAYKDGLKKEDFENVYHDFRNYREIKSLKHRRYFYSQINKSNLHDLYNVVTFYNDYMKMAKKLKKNLKSDYWIYPGNLKQRHDKVMGQLERIRELERMKREEKERTLRIRRELKAIQDNAKIKDYCERNNISADDYAQFKILNSQLPESEKFSITPRNFTKALDYCTSHDLNNKDNVATLYRQTVEKFQQYSRIVNGYSIFVPQNIFDIEEQAKSLHQCLITCNYPRQIIRKSCVLVFIRKENKPIATVEVKNDGTIGQFHLDQKLDNFLPSKELEDTFNKWYKDADLRICS